MARVRAQRDVGLDTLYRSLYLIRRVEEEVARIYPTDKIKSPVHLSIGQEAISVGVCQALRADDVVFGTYRGHALYLAKGGDLKSMIAELYGKAAGVTKGKGGLMHLIDLTHGIMGGSAVVGTAIPHAVGYAYALKLRGSDSIVTSFFGDGATEEGVFYESLNFAALKRLPVLFVCENNFYAIHSPLQTRQANLNMAERASSLGVVSRRLVDDDVLTLVKEVGLAAAAIRQGGGPRFLECPTYRWKEHVGPSDDYHAGYRTLDEAKPWMERDQVRLVGSLLAAPERQQIELDVEREVSEAFDFAESSPFPEDSDLMTDVYAD